MIVSMKGDRMPDNIRVMIPQLMAEKGIKVKDIAEVLGISRPTAGKIAKGQMLPSDPDQLAKLFNLLEAKPEDILILQDA